MTTPGQRQVGMMYRKKLADDRGMLFIFPEEKPRSFWMKNTYVELDIIFIDSAFVVTNVVHRAVPLTTTSRKSTRDALYVVEVRGGLAEKWRVTSGSKLVVAGKLPPAS